MLNHITIMGRLTRDPELRTTQAGVSVTSFTVAVDRDFGGRDGGERQTDFIDIVAWRQQAEFASKFFTKGSMAIVTGRLQIRDWTDRDGNKRTSAEVVADNVYFGDSKRDRGENGGGYQAPRGNDGYQPRSNEAYQSRGNSYQSFDSAPSASAFSELSDTDGELPF